MVASNSERYATFVSSWRSTTFGHISSDTWYARSFKEAWPGEVLFVTQSEARRNSIKKLIDRFEKHQLPARALTVDEAQRDLRRALHGRDRTATGPSKLAPVAPADAREPARSAAEERLRRGRVSVRGEQLVNFEKVLSGSLAALASAQKALAIYPIAPDAMPRMPAGASEILRVLAEYARRGQEALSRHRLTAAD